MRRIGRPKVSKLSRKDQLRRAKRAQRARQKRDGLVDIQLTLPEQTAEKLRIARRDPGFAKLLDAAVENMIVKVSDYEQLRDLAWSRTDELIPAKEAFQLYERNWRFVEPEILSPKEKELIERLKTNFGNGLINA